MKDVRNFTVVDSSPVLLMLFFGFKNVLLLLRSPTGSIDTNQWIADVA